MARDREPIEFVDIEVARQRQRIEREIARSAARISRAMQAAEALHPAGPSRHQTASKTANWRKAPRPPRSLDLAWSTGTFPPPNLPRDCWQPGATHIRIGRDVLRLSATGVDLWHLDGEAWRHVEIVSYEQSARSPLHWLRAMVAKFASHIAPKSRARRQPLLTEVGQATIPLRAMLSGDSGRSAYVTSGPWNRWRFRVASPARPSVDAVAAHGPSEGGQ